MRFKKILSLLLATFVVISSFVCDFSVLFASEMTTPPAIFVTPSAVRAGSPRYTTPPAIGFDHVNAEGLWMTNNNAVTSYDVKQKKSNGGHVWTTFNAGGYWVHISINPAPTYDNSAHLALLGEGNPTKIKIGTGGAIPNTPGNIAFDVTSSFINNEKYLKVTYTLKNLTDADIPHVSVGTSADIQIGGDDYASIYRTPTGFRMAHRNTSPSAIDIQNDPGAGMQFSLACSNASGVTNVDTMWFGRWDSGYGRSVFTSTPNDIKEFKDGDSALCFSWKNKTLPANGELKFSVLFGIGEIAPPPRHFSVDIDEENLWVDAFVTDDFGRTDTLYYTVDGGAERILGQVPATGDQENIRGYIDPADFPDPGDYEIHVWVMNDKGMMSETVIIKLHVEPPIEQPPEEPPPIDPPPIDPPEPEIITIRTTVNPKNSGTTSGDGNYLENELVVLTATPKDGYRFVSWTEEAAATPGTAPLQNIISNKPTMEFPAVRNRVLDANFVPIDPPPIDPPPIDPPEPEIITIRTTVNPKNSGTTSGDGNYLDNELVVLTATPKDGYRFVSWTEEAAAAPGTAPLQNIISNKPTMEFRAVRNRVLGANFVPISSDSDDTPPVIPDPPQAEEPPPPGNPTTGFAPRSPIVKLMGQIALSALYTIALWFMVFVVAVLNKYHEITQRQKKAAMNK